jgi:hypothetical protein
MRLRILIRSPERRWHRPPPEVASVTSTDERKRFALPRDPTAAKRATTEALVREHERVIH